MKRVNYNPKHSIVSFEGNCAFLMTSRMITRRIYFLNATTN